MITPTIIRACHRSGLLATVTQYCDRDKYPLTFQIYSIENTGKTTLETSEQYASQVDALDRFQDWMNSPRVTS